MEKDFNSALTSVLRLANTRNRLLILSVEKDDSGKISQFCAGFLPKNEITSEMLKEKGSMSESAEVLWSLFDSIIISK